jgi:hypothetical protein
MNREFNNTNKKVLLDGSCSLEILNNEIRFEIVKIQMKILTKSLQKGNTWNEMWGWWI